MLFHQKFVRIWFEKDSGYPKTNKGTHFEQHLVGFGRNNYFFSGVSFLFKIYR